MSLSVAIPTRGNDRLVARCVENLLDCATRYGRTADLLVCSDASAGEICSESARAIQRWSATAGTAEIVDRAARERLVNYFVEVGAAPRSVAEFALFGTTVHSNFGAGRNAIALCNHGTRYVSFDDDTICSTVTIPQLAEVDLNRWSPAGADPIEYWFVGGCEQSTVTPIERDVDLLGLYSAAIGANLGINNCVVLCASGIAGMSGLDSQSSLVTHESDAVWSRLCASPAEFARVQSGCPVVRQSPQRVFGRDAMFLSTSFGVDGRGLVPPFMPSYRGEDAVFWLMLRRLRPEGVCAHLPVCVMHQPAQSGVSRRDFAVPRVCHFVAQFVAARAGDRDFDMSIVKEASALMDLAQRPEREFVEAALAAIRDWAGISIATMDQLLNRRMNRTPPYVADLMHRQIALLEYMCGRPEHAIPLELRDSPNPWRSLAQYIHSFGELLECWPAMLRASRDRPRFNAGRGSSSATAA